MAFETEWYKACRVIYVRAFGHLSTEDTIKIAKESVALIEGCPTERVHFLMDTVALRTFTRDVFALSSSVQSLMAHPRYGWFVMYGRDDAVVRFIASIVTQVFRRPFKICDTREEAESFVQDLVDAEDNGEPLWR